jgi:uncharacterized membrane protein
LAHGETGPSIEVYPMTWLQRYRLHNFVASSVWLAPLVGLVAALLLSPLVHRLDAALGWKAAVDADSARAVLGALTSSMLTFIVFVFSILLVAVQLASAQLSPRIIATIYRRPVLRLSLTLFVFAFTFSLAALARIGDSVPQIAVWIAVYSSVASIAAFLVMLDRVGKSLRPVIVLTLIGNNGKDVIDDVYPHLMDDRRHGHAGSEPALDGVPVRTVAASDTGVVLAVDFSGLLELARRADCAIEFVPQVGDFVASGDPLFRMYGGGEGISDRALHDSVAIGAERTMEQDPAFAFRIIVDVAAKALSPAINDPTTGVLALDQIHRLLRIVGRRQLDTGRLHDAAGRLRLFYRTPDWEDFVGLAVTEIRQFGGSSIQIVRRMRAMLENLIEVLPPERAVQLRVELDVLNRTVERDFPDLEDRTRAAAGDSLGVG